MVSRPQIHLQNCCTGLARKSAPVRGLLSFSPRGDFFQNLITFTTSCLEWTYQFSSLKPQPFKILTGYRIYTLCPYPTPQKTLNRLFFLGTRGDFFFYLAHIYVSTPRMVSLIFIRKKKFFDFFLNLFHFFHVPPKAQIFNIPPRAQFFFFQSQFFFHGFGSAAAIRSRRHFCHFC